MNDEERLIVLEQVNAINSKIADLRCRVSPDNHPIASSISRDYLNAIEARCCAIRGILKASDWE